MSEESTEKRYTFTLDKEIVKEAKKRAVDEEITMSALVEDLLKQYAKGELNYGD